MAPLLGPLPSPLSGAIAAADALFAASPAATGATFDLADYGAASYSPARYAAFVPCSDLGRPSRLVGLYPDLDSAIAASVAGVDVPRFPLGFGR